MWSDRYTQLSYPVPYAHCEHGALPRHDGNMKGGWRLGKNNKVVLSVYLQLNRQQLDGHSGLFFSLCGLNAVVTVFGGDSQHHDLR